MEYKFTKDDVEIAKKELKIEAEDCDKIKKAILDSGLTIEEKCILAFWKLKSQSSGIFIENLVKEKFLFTNISSSEGNGDFKTNTKKYVECKAGMFNINGTSNIPQCRPYQKIDLYLIYKYDPINDFHFISLCPSDIINNKCKKIISSSHGDKISNKKNKNNEKSIRISYKPSQKIPNAVYKELEKYSVKTFDELSKNENWK